MHYICEYISVISCSCIFYLKTIHLKLNLNPVLCQTQYSHILYDNVNGLLKYMWSIFLNQGCTHGLHSNEKPKEVEPEKANGDTTEEVI